jgi:hypothetical protein
MLDQWFAGLVGKHLGRETFRIVTGWDYSDGHWGIKTKKQKSRISHSAW